MLSFEKITLMSANLGEKNNVPDITAPKNPLWFTHDETVSDKEGALFGVGMVSSVLPYKMQNLYDRDVKPREYSAVILENEYLKAVFLTEFGGRLWSLYDKKLKKDLIYENGELIFANLALRNAWFAGGVEWNVGVRGHSYFTCSPLFAQKVTGKLGHEILRMYEYEEIRGLVYCIEATLEKDNLLISVSVKNTKETPTYMYWWSNIAVEEKKGTRVFVPARKSFVTSYQDGGFCVSKTDIPYVDGKDVSDPFHAVKSVDYFYDIPEENKKWIASVEGDGKGLLQYSDKRLFGRKTFLWGGVPGGRHWNKWLTDGRGYYEIQAGLCKTQFEHFGFEGGEEISWREVYRGIDIGTNIGEYTSVCDKIDAAVPEEFDFGEIFTEISVEPHFTYGRGKGYLCERINKTRLYEKCTFPKESVGENEMYYLALLDGEDAVGDEYTEYICGGEWARLIESKKSLRAFDKYILGIIYYRAAEYKTALDYFESSVNEDAKFYSEAALALLYANVFDKKSEALEHSRRAIALRPDYTPLSVKYGEIAIKFGEFAAFVEFYETAPDNVKENGRIKMYVGQCLVALGETKRAKDFINEDLVVEDFKEGEYSISEIWAELYRKELAAERGVLPESVSKEEALAVHPLPYKIDFKMH